MSDTTLKNSIVSKASQKLDPAWIKTLKVNNRPELSYVPIDKTIKFLNETYGDNWEVRIKQQNVTERMAYVVIELSIKENDITVVRDGIGADIHTSEKYAVDLDKLVKTAYANAVKKATNMFGFASELWDESNVGPSAGDSSKNANQMPIPERKLSDQSRKKIDILMQDTGYSKAELTEFLIEFDPTSGGSPLVLTNGDENSNVERFIEFVKKQR